MENLKKLVEEAFEADNKEIVRDKIENCTSWHDAYDIGECLVEHSESSWDRLAVDALEFAFLLGLNIKSNRECFLEATRDAAKLYFQYSDYENAKSHLLLLISNEEDLPAWVHLYFATAQVHTEDLLRIAEDPLLFFRRLDKVDKNDFEASLKRDSVFRNCLSVISEYVNDGKIAEVAIKAFADKASEYSLGDCEELYSLKVALGLEIDAKPAELPPDNDNEGNDTQSGEEVQSGEVGAVNDDKDEIIAKLKSQLEEALSRIERLEKELEEKAAAIVGLNGVINNLQEKLKEAEAVHGKQDIVNQPGVIETIQEPAVASPAEYKPEEEIQQIDMGQYLPRNKKILIIGGTEAKEKDLRGVCKSLGYLFNKKDLEFELEYSDIKTLAGRIRQWNCGYAGIIVGPAPHKTQGSGDYSSFIERIKNEEGYPFVVEAKEKNGTLKISKSSFKSAITKMVNHLVAVA